MSRRHGHCARGRATITWNSWHCMVRRCKDAFRSDHALYYAKGITVCDRWDPEVTDDAFSRFLADMGERPSRGHSIGRLDPARGYSRENCAWLTWHEQNLGSRYQGKNMLEVGGQSLTKSEWAAEVGVTYKTFLQRIRRGWTVDEACTVRLGERRRRQ